jgi:hypothetical protein
MARKKNIRFHKYKCSITGEQFKVTSQAQNPDELVSIKAWYELNGDKDDRPEVVKRELEVNGELEVNFDDQEDEEGQEQE